MRQSPPGDIPAVTLPVRLRLAREHAGLTQAQLADLLEIARATVNIYETGRRVPSRSVLIAWALECGVDLEWLQGHPTEAATFPTARRGFRKPGRLTGLHGIAAATAMALAGQTIG